MQSNATLEDHATAALNLKTLNLQIFAIDFMKLSLGPILCST